MERGIAMKLIAFLFLFAVAVLTCNKAEAKDTMTIIPSTSSGIVTTTDTLRVEKMPPLENNNRWVPIIEDTGTGKFVREYINVPGKVEWKIILNGNELPKKGDTIPKGQVVIGIDEFGNMKAQPSEIYQP